MDEMFGIDPKAGMFEMLEINPNSFGMNQMTVGGLIEELEGALERWRERDDFIKVSISDRRDGSCFFVDDLHLYRGSKGDVGLSYSVKQERNIKLQEFYKRLKGLVGKRIEGYEGEGTITPESLVWASEFGAAEGIKVMEGIDDKSLEIVLRGVNTY